MSASPVAQAGRPDPACIRTEVVTPACQPGADGLLVARLAEEMAAAWRCGRRPGVEEVFAAHADLWANREALLRLVCEEICLRQEAGEEIALAEWTARFPELQVEIRNFLGSRPSLPDEPDPLDDFELLCELGRGAQGRVYLARQRSLADRPVVLKVTDRGGREHLALARLQHTHIVPLYWVQDDPGADRRTLCMPFLGTLTLAGLLQHLRRTPAGNRTGQDILAALDSARAGSAVPLPSRGPTRQALGRATYGQAVAWVGACLAEGLQYAHERGLVHLDVKPSNVLLAADATPMLLDFHLARPPLRAGEAAPWGVGGTPLYMAPEQRAASSTVATARPVPAAVDGRSDVYSLGLVLYQALGGPVPLPARPPRLERVNGQVSVGLADVVHRCLEVDAARRYADAAALAADLRRHLADLPLRGVPNRSPAERWAKWRRRRPHALPLLILVAALLAGGVGAAVHHVHDREGRAQERLRRAEEALQDGERLLRGGQYPAAAQVFDRGLDLAGGAPESAPLARRLAAARQQARRLDLAERLHRLTDALRLAALGDRLPEPQVRTLEASCRALWEARDRLTGNDKPDDEVARGARADLLDLAVLRAELLARLAAGPDARRARKEALAVLAEAEGLFGRNAALLQARRELAQALGQTDMARAADLRLLETPARTAWEYCALGRTLLHEGDLAGAGAAFERAAALEPSAFWPHFYGGACAFRRGDHAAAESAFRVCTALAPGSAAAWHNRGLALDRLGKHEQALADYGRALERAPDLAEAALNRAALLHRLGRQAEALADVRSALEKGGETASGLCLAARIHLARAERAEALASLERVLAARPDHPEALALYRKLRPE